MEKIENKHMNTANKGHQKNRSIQNVLYAPEGSKSVADILSISKKGFTFTFDGKDVTMNMSTFNFL